MAYAGGRAILIVSLVLCAVNPPHVNAEQAIPLSAPQLLIPNPIIPVLASNPGEVTLRWTAPGDDGNIGTAHHYVVRYSSNTITESNWGSAIEIPNPPAPLPAGSVQSFTFSGLTRGTPYYFAIRTYDEAGNVSGLSNVVRKFTGGILTPNLAGDMVDSVRAIAVLDADTVAAPVRLKYQFALDSLITFPHPTIASDSLPDSLASVTYMSLSHGRRYFWRCRAMAFDNSDSSFWSYADSFYMPSANNDTPRVLVSSPNGGETWNIGSSHAITWSATDSGGVTSYAIDYSTDAGTDWIAVQPQTNGNPLTFNWLVPATASGNCLVRVLAWDPSGNIGSDVSNAAFAIVSPDIIPPAVALSSPNGGEQWYSGSIHPITWSATDSAGVASCAIDYSTNSGANWIAIQPQTNGNPLTYAWTVPATPSSNCLARVRAWDPSGNIGSDVSNAAFAIAAPPDTIPPVVAVTSPNGGEKWRAGMNRYIRWTDSDNVGITMNKIEYSTNGGANWILIRDWTSGDPHTFGWWVPDLPSVTCLVRVSVGDGAGNINSDISNGNFTIRGRINAVIAGQPASADDPSESQFSESLLNPPLYSQGGVAIPSDYFLGQSYPNPFNAITRIDYGLPAASYVTLDIYDITGRHVETLVNEYQQAGYHSLTWNSSNEASGVFLYCLNAGPFSQTMKMTVLK